MNDSDNRPGPRIVSSMRERIKGKAAIIALGNILRGDDGLAPKLIELLRPLNLNASLFDCGTAPENYAIPILSTSADTLIFVDAADLKKPAGSVCISSLEEISTVSFSTHSPSPRLFIDLLKTARDDLNIFFVVVQPKSTAFGLGLSEEAKRAIETLRDVFREVLGTAPTGGEKI